MHDPVRIELAETKSTSREVPVECKVSRGMLSSISTMVSLVSTVSCGCEHGNTFQGHILS